MKVLFSGACAVALSASLACASTVNERFTGYFALGDSLSDPGNVYAASGGKVPPAPYVDGRFSNGPTFSEYLAGGFDPAQVRNYAYGFAEAVNPGDEPLPAALALHLDEQLALFLNDAAGGGAAGSLVTLLFGANDIFEELDTVAATTPSNPFPQLFNTATTAAMAVSRAIASIVDTGPAEVVLLNLPDLGMTPGYSGTPLAPLATYASAAYNAGVSSVPSLSKAGTDVTLFDLAALFDKVRANPRAYGVDPALLNSACFEQAISDTCDAYLFADAVHPTTRIHELLAQILAEELETTSDTAAPVPLPAGLPLLAAGLGLLALFGRRRAA